MGEQKIKVIYWDFDGVLMNSNEVRDRGFEIVLKDYPQSEVEELLAFHRENGGLSRYVKFRYFFEELRGEKVSDDEVIGWAAKFSEVMREELVNPSLLIDETVDFVKRNHENYKMYIVSGSDQSELRYLCNQLKIDCYFDSIHGSPKPKTKWVQELIHTHNYDPKNCILIGDSKNDYDAAVANGITFVGYGNKEIVKLGELDWDHFKMDKDKG